MDDRKTDKNTVFVRGVSFDVQDRELNDFFSDIGPVRQAFLVKSRGGAKHKGYGFVQFALQTDAERAATELNGKELQGRKLQVIQAYAFHVSAHLATLCIQGPSHGNA